MTINILNNMLQHLLNSKSQLLYSTVKKHSLLELQIIDLTLPRVNHNKETMFSSLIRDKITIMIYQLHNPKMPPLFLKEQYQ